jgi:hypothetical protein
MDITPEIDKENDKDSFNKLHVTGEKNNTLMSKTTISCMSSCCGSSIKNTEKTLKKDKKQEKI